MKRVIILFFLAFIFSENLLAQCSTVPVKEAVRNGDFEAGYLGGTVFTSNSPVSKDHPAVGTGGLMDFSSDLSYAGMYSPTGTCKYSIADQYGVGRVENPSCDPGGGGSKNTVYAQYGSDNGAGYKDHTLGTDQGFALFFDFNDPSDNVVGKWKKVWGQTVDVYPNQNYYFSAWFTQYRQQSTITSLRFRVEFLDASGVMIGTSNNIGTASPSMGWTFEQFLGSIISPVNAVKANLYIDADPSGIYGTDDLIIDDISFINSCQNIASQNSYSVEFAKDSVNLCEEGGSYLAQVLKTTGGNLTAAGKVITWYRGAGANQTEITAWANQVNPAITETDVYRVCVEDALNGCPVSAIIVAYETVAYTPANVTLCSPSSVVYDAGYNFPNGAMSIAWSGPSGTGSGKTYTVNKAGTHTVTIIPLGAHSGCTLSKSFTVSSNLPAAPTNLEYCDGGGTATSLTLGDGKPYKWSTSQTMTPLIGSGTSVSWTPTAGTTGDQTLYFQSASTTPLGTVGAAATFSGYQEAGNGITFTTTKATVLNSFVVTVPSYACAWGTTTLSATFNITGQAPYVQNITCGANTTITPNWDLPAGTYTLSYTVSGNFCFATGLSTATLGAGAVTITPNASNHYFAASLTFSNSEACDPVPVVIKAISCCAAPTDIPDIDLLTSVLSVCAPNKASVVSKGGLSSTLDYQWQVSHNAGTTWTDTLAAGVVGATGKVSLTNIAAGGVYRLVVALSGNLSKSCVKTDTATVVIKPLPTNISITVAPNQTQFCEGIAHTLTASATTGSTFQWKYDGVGTSTTTPGLTTVGTHNYKVVATLNGCVDSSAMKTITINAIPDSTITPIASLCSSGAAVTLTAATTGGIWKVDAATLTGNSFDPKLYSVGTHQIHYDVTVNGCSAHYTITVEITDKQDATITAVNPMCKNSPKINLQAADAGGTWSGTNISNVNSGEFTPSTAGTFTITYTIAGSCGDSKTTSIVVNDLDSAKVLPGGPFCSADPDYTMKLTAGTTAGGTWSGQGITDAATGLFSPASLSNGTYTVKYTTAGACPSEDSVSVSISNTVTLQITSTQTTYCKNGSLDTIEVLSLGGKFSTSSGKGITDADFGYYNPKLADVGTDTIWYMKEGSCGDTVYIPIEVLDIDTAKITVPQSFCQSEGIVTLAKEAISNAGIWSGTGITDGTTGAFNTAIGEGLYLITYTTSGTCSLKDTATVRVFGQMTVDILPLTLSLCEDNELYQIQKSVNTTPDGTWLSLPAGMVNTSGQFDAALATAGSTYRIYYVVSGATLTCSAVDSVDITVVQREEASITTGTTLSLCVYDAPEPLTVLNTGGSWSGTGVDANGVFDPAIAGAGGHSVRYKINGATGACPDEDTILITVTAPADATIKAAGPFCENLQPKQLETNVSGGTFSGTGVSANGLFDPSVAGVGMHWIKYTQGGMCPNTDSIEIQVDAVPNAIISPDVLGGCVPVTINFGDSSTADVATAHWDFGDGTTKDMTSADASTSHQFTTAGEGITINLAVVFINGCKDNTSQKVSVTEVPAADFSFDPLPASSDNPQIIFTNKSENASSYLWNFGSTALPDTSVNTDEVVLFDAPDGDTVLVTLTAKNSVCINSIQQYIYIKDVFTLFTSNAFTPNGDGNNDVFYPQGKNLGCEECSNYQFLIFNKWGEVIFKSVTPYEAWNGKRSNNMHDAEIDVYVWQLTYTNSFTGKHGAKTGHVTLLR